MYDLVVRGGTLIDGTGSPRVDADVAIQGGRIAAIGDASTFGGAKAEIDATGRIVAPGFVDIHTHYDAQAFWDTTLSPSPLHGVTTVSSGNCGFTLAPVTPDDTGYLARMLARVEGMPLEVIEASVTFDWGTTGEMFDRIDGTLMLNCGFLVGHSALRRVVMHDDATRRAATPAEIEQMRQLLRAGLAAGGLGFSSTWSPSHSDHQGVPVPSRWAEREELLALCDVVGEFDGTVLEFIPGTPPFSTDLVELMADMSATARRPLNWNVLTVNKANAHLVDDLLAASDVADQRGGKVIALTAPGASRLRLSFQSGFVLDMMPGWASFIGSSPQERIAALSDPERRAQLGANAAKADTISLRYFARWSDYVLETLSPENAEYNGKTVGEIAELRGQTPWDALCDVVVADDLKTTMIPPARGDDDESWRIRGRVWNDERALIGASDAGAHLDMIDTFNYTTVLLGEGVRKRQLLSLERAVHLLTDRPARLYGFRERGRIQQGWHADLVVFDEHTVGAGPVTMRRDMPGGGARVYGGAVGIDHVLVNGVPVVRGDQFLTTRPGVLLRSGRDTTTETPLAEARV